MLLLYITVIILISFTYTSLNIKLSVCDPGINSNELNRDSTMQCSTGLLVRLKWYVWYWRQVIAKPGKSGYNEKVSERVQSLIDISSLVYLIKATQTNYDTQRLFRYSTVNLSK
mgnify:CR=1 FL=1